MNYKLVSDSSSNVYTLSGAKKAVSVLVDMLGERGYEDGKVTVEAGKETITFEKSEIALVRLRVEF